MVNLKITIDTEEEAVTLYEKARKKKCLAANIQTLNPTKVLKGTTWFRVTYEAKFTGYGVRCEWW